MLGLVYNTAYMDPVQGPEDGMRAMPTVQRQAKFNPEIFHRYDIRGAYGVDFDDQFSRELANKIVTHYGSKTVLVARDGRASGAGLERLVNTGITQAGADAISIGISTTPLFYWSVLSAKADLGIMITASHNPPQYNGFKVLKGDGTLVGGEPLKKLFAEEYIVTNGAGTEQTLETRAQYLEQIIAMAGPEPLNVAVSANLPPLMDQHLGVLAQQYGITLDRSASLHIHMDPDADRISFYENGEKIPADFICALLADQLGATKVVHDLRFSRSVLEYWANKGITSTASRIGRLDMARNMREKDADIGGEISAHFFFKQFNYLEAPEAVLLLVLRAMQTAGKSLNELIAPYQKYFKSEEITLENKDRWITLRQRFKDTFKDGTITENDGITIEYSDDMCR